MGLGLSSAVVFLRIRLGVGDGDTAGDSTTESDAPLSTGGVASVLFSVRCFAGEGDSVGGVPVSSWDRTCATPIVRLIPNIKPIIRTEDFSAVTINPFSSQPFNRQAEPVGCFLSIPENAHVDRRALS